MSDDARTLSPGRGASRLVRALGALLWLYPPRFRRRYGAEWRDAVDRLANERRYELATGRWRLVRHLLAVTLPSASREWGQAIVQASIPGGIAATAPVQVMATEIAAQPTRLIMAPEDLDTMKVFVPILPSRHWQN